jgi:hypothetical protein
MYEIPADESIDIRFRLSPENAPIFLKAVGELAAKGTITIDSTEIFHDQSRQPAQWNDSPEPYYKDVKTNSGEAIPLSTMRHLAGFAEANDANHNNQANRIIHSLFNINDELVQGCLYSSTLGSIYGKGEPKKTWQEYSGIRLDKAAELKQLIDDNTYTPNIGSARKVLLFAFINKAVATYEESTKLR